MQKPELNQLEKAMLNTITETKANLENLESQITEEDAKKLIINMVLRLESSVGVVMESREIKN